MSLLDRFRSPPLKSPDPAVRAAAVRQLAPAEQARIADIARTDPDPQVRRAAVGRLSDPAELAERARGDADEAVREAAAGLLLRVARSETDPGAARAALAGLSQSRHLADVARESPIPDVRAEAVSRLQSPRALAAVARTATHTDARLAAVQRLGEAPLLAELALKCEYKDAALAAVEKLADRPSLEAVAARARSKAAARRALARLEAMPSSEPDPEILTAGTSATPTDTTPDGSPEPTAEPPRGAAEPLPVPAGGDAVRETPAVGGSVFPESGADEEARAPALAERVVLCETVESLEGEDAPGALKEAQEAWARLPPLAGLEGETLERRFVEAGEHCRRRFEAWFAARDRRARMDALCTELEELADHPDLRVASERWAILRKDWSGLQSMDEVDEPTQARYARAVARIEARQAEARVRREGEARESLGRLQALCERLEALAAEAQPGLREGQRALREAREALQQPPRLPTKRDRETVLARLKAARAALYPRVQEMRQAEEWKRWANVAVQEELCHRMEEVVGLEDIPQAARELRELEARWTQASQAPREQGEALWQRFKAARDQVRARCRVHFAAEAAQRAENLRKKQALCAEAESLADSTDWVSTAERLQALQAEWKTIGAVPRQQARPLWERFRGACGRFFERRKADRARRAAERRGNLEKKQALVAQVEALAGSTDWDKAQAEVKRLQADWKAVGPVRKDRSEAVWQQFREACDRVFERYRRREEIESEGRLAAREALCAQLEALVSPPAGEAIPEDLPARVRAAQVAWKDGGRLAGDRAQALDQRFGEAIQRLLEAWPERFRGTELDPQANRRKMEKLCESVEALAAEHRPADAAASPAERLAQQLREALATNTMRGRVDEGARRRELRERVAAAQAAFNRLGPVPGEVGRALRQRFQEACQRLLTA